VGVNARETAAKYSEKGQKPTNTWVPNRRTYDNLGPKFEPRPHKDVRGR